MPIVKKVWFPTKCAPGNLFTEVWTNFQAIALDRLEIYLKKFSGITSQVLEKEQNFQLEFLKFALCSSD